MIQLVVMEGAVWIYLLMFRTTRKYKTNIFLKSLFVVRMTPLRRCQCSSSRTLMASPCSGTQPPERAAQLGVENVLT